MATAEMPNTKPFASIAGLRRGYLDTVSGVIEQGRHTEGGLRAVSVTDAMVGLFVSTGDEALRKLSRSLSDSSKGMSPWQKAFTYFEQLFIWSTASRYPNGAIILQDGEELNKLLHMMEERDVRTVLEIGSYKGGTTSAFDDVINRKHGYDGEIISLDIIKTPNLFTKSHHTVLRGDSTDPRTVAKVSRLLEHKGLRVDMLFLDASHSFDAPGKDFLNFEPFVKQGGMVVLDDINNHNVGWYYERIKKEALAHGWKCEEIREPKGWRGNWNGYGILFKPG